jgi:hypothetical protein
VQAVRQCMFDFVAAASCVQVCGGSGGQEWEGGVGVRGEAISPPLSFSLSLSLSLSECVCVSVCHLA